VTLRQEHRAGEKLFVDFAGRTIPVIDPSTGEVRQAELFVAVLGASNYLYAEACFSQALPDWIATHVHSFEFLGCVPKLLVCDNLKSGVTTSHRYEPQLNRSYQEMAAHYGVAVMPARAYKPRDKAKVEVGVQIAERWIIARLRHQQFFSLAELNIAIKEQTRQLNARPFRGEPASRAELFAEIEAPALRALPEHRYELASWKKVTANIDYHVEFDHRFYSVPYRLVRQRLELRATASTIEVFKDGRRLASHPREHGRRRYVTDPDHMPASHRAHLQWTPSRLVRWAGTISPDTASVVEAILIAKPHPEQGYRACLGLMSLARRYGNERMGAACRRALACGAVSYSSVKSILAENLDRLPLPSSSGPTPPPPAHENLRGAAYWHEEA